MFINVLYTLKLSVPYRDEILEMQNIEAIAFQGGCIANASLNFTKMQWLLYVFGVVKFQKFHPINNQRYPITSPKKVNKVNRKKLYIKVISISFAILYWSIFAYPSFVLVDRN